MTTDRTQEAYERLQRRLDWPMLVVALVYLPVLLVPLFATLPEPLDTAFTVVDYLIWFTFVVEYVALFVVAPDRWQMVRTHVLDLVIIIVPASPLRALRILRLLRLLAIFGRAGASVRQLMRRPGLQGYLAFAAAAIAICGVVVFLFERDSSSQIDSFGDAMWWSIVTATTVGYGDAYPVTPEGRIAAVVLMFVGISLLSVVTANIAAFLIEHDPEEEEEKVTIAEMNVRLEGMEQMLQELLDDAERRDDAVTAPSMNEAS